MKNLILIIFCIICSLNINLKTFAQGYSEEKAMADKYLQYLESLNAFDENKDKYKAEFKVFKRDVNRKENIERIKSNNTKSENGYKVKPNYKTLRQPYDYDMDSISSKVIVLDGTDITRDALVSYGVIYDNSPDYKYVYDTMGNLQQVQISEKEYKKIYSYNGSLQSVIYTGSDGQIYMYNSNGKYWRRIKNEKLW